MSFSDVSTWLGTLIPLCQFKPNITITFLFGRSFYDYG